MRYFVLIFLSFIIMTNTSGARAATDVDTREKIQNVLSQLHPTDTPEWWRGLGPDAPGTIISMYEHESFVYHRLRLVQALAWFNDPAATAFLEKQANESNDDVIRNGAIQSLGTSSGPSEDDFIAGFLNHRDPQTRLVAAQALRKAGDEKAQNYLNQFMSHEKIQWVRDRYTTGILAPAPFQIIHPVTSIKALKTISPDFSGTWKGTLLVPQFKEEKGMQSYSAELVLSFDSTTQNLHGILTVQNATNSVVARFDRVQGDGHRFQAELPWNDLKILANGRLGENPRVLALDIEQLPETLGSGSNPIRVLRGTVAGLSSEVFLRREP
jgi:hypothetical protein